MKKSPILLFFGFWAFALSAQPQGINYQAIARTANGQPIGGTTLMVKFEIFSNVLGVGAPLFNEDQTALTDPVTGLFNLTIGAQNQAGFAAIDWAGGPKFLRVTIENVQGPITQMLSVPYALYAKSAGNGQSYNAGPGISINGNTISNIGDNDNDQTNELQTLQLSGDQLSISNGNTVTLPPNNDNSPTNELQTLSLNGNTLTLSPSGGSVILPTGGGTDDQTLSISGNQLSIENGNTVIIDGSATNELQNLSVNGNQLTIQNGNTVLIDGSATNELQTLSLTGNQLTLSPSGGSITLPTGGGTDDQTLSISGNQLSIENGNTVPLPVYTAGQGITVVGNVITNVGDLSPSNELQTLSLTGSTLTLSPNGGSVTIPDDQTLSISGNQLSIENGNTITLPNIGGGSDDQTLSISGNQLTIENGNTVTLPTGTTYTAGPGIGISGNVISNTGDNSTSNELQTLSFSNNQLSISNGNSVNLYQAGSGISINGTTISANDVSSTNELQQLQLNSNTNVLSLTPSGGSVTLPSGYILPGSPGTTCSSGFLPFDCAGCYSLAPAFRVQNNCDGTAIEGVSVSSAGSSAALKGTALGVDGNGIWGECNSGNEAWAVFGTSNNGWGVVGYSGNPSVEGAGLFNGRIIVTNTLQSEQMANWASQSHTKYTWSGVQTSSDIRLKKDVESLKYGLKEILAMRPVSYLWKSEEENSKKTLGFIAQEMVSVVPELVDVPIQEKQVASGSSHANPQKVVDTTADQTWSMNYTEITPVLVKAVQEQQAQIEALKAAVQKKDEQIKELSAKMDAMESLLKNMQTSAGK